MYLKDALSPNHKVDFCYESASMTSALLTIEDADFTLDFYCDTETARALAVRILEAVDRHEARRNRNRT